MIFVVASILAVAIFAAAVPSAANQANEANIRNGQEPTGVSIAPGLIALIFVWLIGTLVLDRFLGRTWAWVLLLGISSVLFGRNLLRARASNREYSSFIRSRISNGWPSYVNGMVATRRWIHPSGREILYLISRSDGTFTTGYEEFRADDYEDYWSSHGPCSIYDSEETAIKEALVEHRWMADVEPESNVVGGAVMEAKDRKGDP